MEASMPAGLSPSQRLQVIGTSIYSQCTATAQSLAWSLLGQKRKCDDLEGDDHNNEESINESESASPCRQLRKRTRISYAEFAESDVESDADSGYSSDSSVDWASPSKQTKPKRARKEKPVKVFPFLSLPSELRNKIYSLALEDPDGMVLHEGWRATSSRNLVYSDQGYHSQEGQASCTLIPSLLAVNKQIYAEAAAILYSQPLHFVNTTALHSFLAPLSNQTGSLIRKITIHNYENWGRGVRKAMNVSAMTLLRSCSNLETLRIEGFSNYYWHGRYWNKPTTQKAGKIEGTGIAQQIYRDAAFWFDTMGAERALRVLDISGLQRDTGDANDEEALRIANVVFVEELTALINRKGRGMKKSRKPKATRA
ncbi:hypothetical protein KCU81_g4350, partial [Aureobasidium melanogenum]|uniref:2EXR domain-containing protein n=1 Tax=Aureobasidium melanogenum (strain CBS 110374) TaxID=1043003 RepID=A0A074VQG3_AURM1